MLILWSLLLGIEEDKMAKPELEFFDTKLIPWKPIEGAPGKYEKN